MIEDAQQPLVETPTEVALADDYARLCAAFREAVGHEDALAARVSSVVVQRDDLRRECDRLQRELDAVLASPTWRAGRLMTALPRLARDRRSL